LRPGAADADQKSIGFAATMLLAIALRAVVLAVGWYSIHSAAPGAAPQFNLDHPWIAWDARHYYQVALNGYAPDRPSNPQDQYNWFGCIAYFPLLPMAARTLSSILPLEVAMVTLSNVCAIIGLGFLYDWARRISGSRIATIVVLVIATFPGAVSFAAGMTEGPFLLLVALALWLLQRRRFYLAALVAGLATATRPTGVALAAVVLLYAVVHDQHFGLALRRKLAHGFALAAISFSGIFSYELFLWQRYGSPTIYLQAQDNWNHVERSRLESQAAQGVERYSWQFFRDRVMTSQAWNRALALAILALTVAGLIKPMGIPRILFLLPLLIFLMTALPGGGLRISSLPRYESASIPIFLLAAIWLGSMRSPRRIAVLAAILVVQFAVQLHYAYQFPREIWVG
jgi:hypothetical protein